MAAAAAAVGRHLGPSHCRLLQRLPLMDRSPGGRWSLPSSGGLSQGLLERTVMGHHPRCQVLRTARVRFSLSSIDRSWV